MVLSDLPLMTKPGGRSHHPGASQKFMTSVCHTGMQDGLFTLIGEYTMVTFAQASLD